ncbi:MAG: TAT-variant-translocated molybdopterin oxidoreductase [Flavobacteriales bacterium]|nr:TAT-variant-translocated molybdopterin oxidoreductase [Flavobacteriales bacterium]
MSQKKYWKGIEDLNEESQIMQDLRNKEFVEEIPTDDFLGDKESLESGSTTRRDFLKYIGFSTAAASLAACEGPVVKSIPYVVKPDNVTPGSADYYATSISDGHDFASVLVRAREGRPIRIEPNTMADYYSTTNARIQANVLSLYDSNRLKAPQKEGEEISWSSVDADIATALATAGDKEIVLLTSSMFSPSTKEIISKFSEKYPTTKHISYDAVSSSGALDAYETLYGKRALPLYNFAEARTIVSFGADFIGDWLGGGYEKGYSIGRNPKQKEMSRHIQVETNMSLAGANADDRYSVKPSEQASALIKLYNIILGENLATNKTPIDSKLAAIAKELKNAGSKALVVTGSNDKNLQILAMKINLALQSRAMCVGKPVFVKEGNDNAVQQLVQDMNSGKVSALICYNVNPVYSLANSVEFVKGMKKVETTVSVTQFVDETTKESTYNLPSQHSLESWGDAMAVEGEYSLMQPTIRPLYDTRQFQDNLLKWMGSDEDFYSFIKNNWKNNILSKKTGSTWNQTLHDGVLKLSLDPDMPTLNEVDMAAVAKAAQKYFKNAKGIELELYVKAGMGNGELANNPWLQELPDPITRTSWDNYLTISAAHAKELGLTNWNVSNGALNGDIVKLSAAGVSMTVPVFIQPGQAYGTLGLALGYGRSEGVKDAMKTGVNAYPFYKSFNKYASSVSIEKVEGEHEFACVQLHHTMMDRDVVQETTFDIYKNKSRDEWNPINMLATHDGNQPVSKIDLWDQHDSDIGPHFNLSIDLNACTGCAACVVACHAENNVAVVGKEEVRKSRDMHWLRIDRYYSSDMTKEKAKAEGLSGVTGSVDMYHQMEVASANPEVVFQPVMCQHCNHAPCETVCPVAATSHGAQGQNQMAYNRCVGTRYCANNCPYKVRRFNWFQYNGNEKFDYHMNDEVGRMVLNPDVVIRDRGVMEKCSMCIQITQAGILSAKKDGRRLEDIDIQTACSSACPSEAMAFGDINNEESLIQEPLHDDRKYYLLETVGTKPNVMYQTKIRNKNS